MMLTHRPTGTLPTEQRLAVLLDPGMQALIADPQLARCLAHTAASFSFRHRFTLIALAVMADRFLVLRAALYADEENPKALTTQGQGLRNDLPHRGFEPLF